MCPQQKYRLQPVLDQKEKARQEAEKALALAHRALAEEERKKQELESEKEALLLRIDQTRQKREELAMSGELTVEKAQRYKLFIQGLNEQRKELDLKIYKQTRAVERAAENVEKAKKVVIQKAKEYEAMSKHREQWLQQQALEVQKKEQKLMEEIGMAQFMKRRGENQ
jgi:flagellar export protein FliJ